VDARSPDSLILFKASLPFSCRNMSYSLTTLVDPSLNEKSEKSPFPPLMFTTPWSSTFAFLPSAPIFEISGSDSPFVFLATDL